MFVLVAQLQDHVQELERNSTWREAAPDGTHGWVCESKTEAYEAKVAVSVGLSFCRGRKITAEQFAEAALNSASCLKTAQD